MRLGRFARSPWVFWLVVAVLALLTGATTSRLIAGAQATAARYGSPRPVVMALRDLEAGAVVEAGDVEVRQVPAGFAPERRLASAGEAVGRTVVVTAFAGSPVLRDHLAPWGVKGVAALLPPGTRAVAVPTGAGSVPLRRGDLVDVLATFDPAVAGGGDPTFAVATAATVIDAGAESATVAVWPEEAEAVAFAMSHASITVAIAPPASEISGTRPPQEPEPPTRPAPGTPRTAGTTPSAPPAAPTTQPALP